MHSFAKKVPPSLISWEIFWDLNEFFYSLTNQLGKIFENFQNIFAPSSGRRRERRFFRVFIKIF